MRNGETIPQISHPEGLQLGKKMDRRRTKKKMAEIGGKTLMSSQDNLRSKNQLSETGVHRNVRGAFAFFSTMHIPFLVVGAVIFLSPW